MRSRRRQSGSNTSATPPAEREDTRKSTSGNPADAPPPSRQRGRETRQLIIEVARRLFSEHGYRATGITDIQMATALTKGALYHHFKTKQEVALAVVEAARQDYDEQWAGQAASADPGEQFEALLDRLAALNEQPSWRNCLLLAMLSAEAGEADGAMAAKVRELRGQIVEVLREAIIATQRVHRAAARIDAGLAAEWIVCTTCGHVLARKLGSAGPGLQELTDAMKKWLLHPNDSSPSEQDK